MAGLFISFEGGEGVGKSTQVRRLAAQLRQAGHAVLETREPGGSTGAEQIRSLLVDGGPERWSALTETLLIYAARRDHLERAIRPALAAGQIVLCDRFIDSTRAYQAGPGGVDPALLDQLEAAVVAPTLPDLTLILDLPAPVGLARAQARVASQGASQGGGEGRFEAKGLAYHQALRQAFVEIAGHQPRCRLLDAAQPVEALSGVIWAEVAAVLAAHVPPRTLSDTLP